MLNGVKIGREQEWTGNMCVGSCLQKVWAASFHGDAMVEEGQTTRDRAESNSYDTCSFRNTSHGVRSNVRRDAVGSRSAIRPRLSLERGVAGGGWLSTCPSRPSAFPPPRLLFSVPLSFTVQVREYACLEGRSCFYILGRLHTIIVCGDGCCRTSAGELTLTSHCSDHLASPTVQHETVKT